MYNRIMAAPKLPLAFLVFLLCFIFFAAPSVYAQQATGVTQKIDISPLLTALISAVALIMPTLAAILVAIINKHLGIANKSAQSQQVTTLIESASQFALGELKSIAAHNGTIDVPAAVAHAYGQISPTGLASAKAIGLTPEAVAQRINNMLVTKLPPTITPPPPSPPPPAS